MPNLRGVLVVVALGAMGYGAWLAYEKSVSPKPTQLAEHDEQGYYYPEVVILNEPLREGEGFACPGTMLVSQEPGFNDLNLEVILKVRVIEKFGNGDLGVKVIRLADRDGNSWKFSEYKMRAGDLRNTLPCPTAGRP